MSVTIEHDLTVTEAPSYNYHDFIDEVATRLGGFHEDSIVDFQGPYAEWKGKHN
jgi:hypothetical protein